MGAKNKLKEHEKRFILRDIDWDYLKEQYLRVTAYCKTTCGMSNEASSCRVVRYSKGQEKPVRVRFFEDGHFCWIVEDWITEWDSELGELCKARKAVIKAREAEAERKRKAEWEEKKHWGLSWLSYVFIELP